jgi:hypothetical protein
MNGRYLREPTGRSRREAVIPDRTAVRRTAFLKGMPQEGPESAPSETFPAPPASDQPDPKVTFNVDPTTSAKGERVDLG